MTTENPRPMVFQLLDSIERELKLVETVRFQVAKEKEKRFLELVDGLISDSKRTPGIIAFHLHRCLPMSQHHTEYLLYEVWRDRDGLKKQWESDFLKAFQSRLTSENLLTAPPELKFFQHDCMTDKSAGL